MNNGKIYDSKYKDRKLIIKNSYYPLSTIAPQIGHIQ